MCFLIHTYSNFWSILIEQFSECKLHISEECVGREAGNAAAGFRDGKTVTQTILAWQTFSCWFHNCDSSLSQGLAKINKVGGSVLKKIMLLSLDRPSPIGLWYKINLSSDQGVPKEHGTDNPLPIFTRTLHRSDLNKGCYDMLHTPLKCNLGNFDIPNA